MSYIIYKKNPIDRVPIIIGTCYNGQAEQIGSGYMTLPYTSNTLTQQVVTITTGCNIKFGRNPTPLQRQTFYLQFDEREAYPTQVDVNGSIYDNDGYYMQIFNARSDSAGEFKIRIKKTSETNKKISIIGISNDPIKKIDQENIMKIECNDICDEILMSIPNGYAEVQVKRADIGDMTENDEITIYFDKELIGRYYVKKVEQLKDDQYRIYAEDIIGLLGNIDGGDINIIQNETDQQPYYDRALNTQILKGYCDFIANQTDLYSFRARWSGLTIRENLHQYILSQNCFLTKESKYNKDTLYLISDQDPQNTGITIPAEKVYNDIKIEQVEIIKEIGITSDTDRYSAVYSSPNAKQKFEIEPEKVKIIGQRGTEHSIENLFLTRIAESTSQSGKVLKGTIALDTVDEIKNTRAGNLISIDTTSEYYGNVYGLVKQITYILTNTIVAKIVLTVSSKPYESNYLLDSNNLYLLDSNNNKLTHI